jgi:hypothetical protein
MLDTFNTPGPTTANFQIFYSTNEWVKPRGASMVGITLVGAGSGGGNGSTTIGGGGGGSGAVVTWIGPSFALPDAVRVVIGSGGTTNVAGGATSLVFQQRDGTGYTLLSAAGGAAVASASVTGGVGGAAFTDSPFASTGIWNSTAGQNGANGSSTTSGSSVTASTSTFLSGGGGGAGGAAGTGGGVTGQYGRSVPITPAGIATPAQNGYSSLGMVNQLLYSLGGAGGTTNDTAGLKGGDAAIGSGGGGSGEDALTGGRGGNGVVIIWSW